MDANKPLDMTTLGIATLASLCATGVTWAAGSGARGALLAALITPVAIAFVTHPGPHRRRRVIAVALLIAFLRLASRALASILHRRTSARPSRPPRRPWRPIVLAGLAAFAIILVGVTVPEIVLGNAFVVKRSTTFFGSERDPRPPHLTPGPTSTPAPSPTRTATPTPTRAPTRTATPTSTRSPTRTPAPTGTPTPTPTPSRMPTRTATPTPAPTRTP